MNTQTIQKSYNPSEIEKRWYARWLEADCFKAQAQPDKQKFTIVIPPPNVTGVLTMGHVLNNTIQDILVRRARQLGKATLWLPGTDHAGIATQTRVEALLRQEGTSRRALGREAFLERACQWRDKHGGIIIEQLKKLGTSCDWSRTVHTLDSRYSKAVLTAFIKLYNSGHVYRGKRMVNWCPASMTALSDEEVLWQKQTGTLYNVRYEIVESSGEYITISTTRPETIMGDTAIAVHPQDSRYAHWIGKHVWRPLQREKIPVIGDEAVLMDFGTGALKVTPAHDALDFQIGKRHNIEVRDIMNPDGTLNELAGAAFCGMDRFEARKAVVKKLEDIKALVQQQLYENQIGYSERANVPIEPRLSEQWFLKYPHIEQAKEVVSSGMIKFYPPRWEKTYLHWLNNIQDWCISRQLWWGHRIPVWYKKGASREDCTHWHVSLEGPADPQNWEQDEDTLDTWFSSWLWPFATLGWPDTDTMHQQGFDYWYPTDDLVTGPDIIFFWVARMIIAGLEFCDEPQQLITQAQMLERIPFKNVYFTGIIRDHSGRKMSKSLGNSPDPLDLIEKYGADGLRFGIIFMAAQGQDVYFNEGGIEQGRNFCNKLYNACRFRSMQGSSQSLKQINEQLASLGSDLASQLDHDDSFILARLEQVTIAVNTALDHYEFNTAIKALHSFFWNDYCDWYIEVCKIKKAQITTTDDASMGKIEVLCQQARLAIQDTVLKQLLLLLHPYIPFITQELWHDMGFSQNEEFIQNVAPLTSHALLEQAQQVNISTQSNWMEQMEHIRAFVTQARCLKAQYGLASHKDVTFTLAATPEQKLVLQQHHTKLERLVGGSICVSASRNDAPGCVTQLGTLYLELAGAVDIASEIERLDKEIIKLQKGVAAGQAKLESAVFRQKAPPNIVSGAEQELTATQAKLEQLLTLINSLRALE